MKITFMSINQFSLSITGNTRNELRQKVIEHFLKETPGTGNGPNTSRYTYFVETLNNGDRVYLTRPAYLKKGFDFLIRVENTQFSNGKDYPKHEDVFNDLIQKKNSNPTLYKKLHSMMTDVFNCQEPNLILKNNPNVNFNTGFSVELILKILKWFFIEQDIRDWNYSGRGMFFSGLNQIYQTGSL